MNESRYLRVAAGVPRVYIADTKANASAIANLIGECSEKGVNLLVTPELGITAYTCADLFRERLLLECAEKACEEVARSTQGTGVTVAFGAPLRCAGKLFNCAVVASGGEIRGVVPKTHLP